MSRQPVFDPENPYPSATIGGVEPIQSEGGWQFHNVPHVLIRREIYIILLACFLAVVSSRIAMGYQIRPAIAIFFALVGGIGVLMEPYLGLIGYYVLAFMRPQEVFWGFGDTRLTLLVAMSTLVGACLYFVRKPDMQFLRSWQNLFLLILWLFLYLSTEYGDFGTPEPKWMSYYNKMFLIYFLALALITSESKLYLVSWVIGGSLGYLGLWANEQYFLNGWPIVHGPGRPGATFYDENGFALVLVMGMTFMWYLMRYTKVWYLRLILLGLLPLTAHAVILTFSRGGFLGMSAAMGWILLKEKNRKLAAGLTVAGMIFFILAAGAEYRDRIGSINQFEEDASAQARFDSWEAGRKMAVRNPFFGVGLKRFMDAYQYYSITVPHVAHNTWIQLAAECGFVAVGAYAMIMLLTWVTLFRTKRRIPRLPPEQQGRFYCLTGMYQAALIGYLVCGFFLSSEELEFYYVIVALVQVADRITRHRVMEYEAGPPVAPVETAKADPALGVGVLTPPGR